MQQFLKFQGQVYWLWLLTFLLSNSLLFSQNLHSSKDDDFLGNAKFHGKILNYQGTDSLRIYLHRHVVTYTAGSISNNMEFYVHPDKEGKFIFELPTYKEPTRVLFFVEGRHQGNEVVKSNNDFIFDYVVEPRDNIELNIYCIDSTRGYIPTFSGTGSKKYVCCKIISHIIFQDLDEERLRYDYGRGQLTSEYIGIHKNAYLNCLKTLDSIKSEISPAVYSILKADAYGRTFDLLLSQYNLLFHRSFIDTVFARPDIVVRNALPKFLDTLKIPSLDDLTKPTANYYALSSSFLVFLIDKELYKISQHSVERQYDFPYLFNQIQNLKTTTFLKDKLLAELLLNPFYRAPAKLDQPSFDKCVATALKEIKTPYIRNGLVQVTSTQRGTTAYNFSLTDPAGKVVRLSDFKGKVVLQDTWFTGCGGCARFHRRFEKEIFPVLKNNPNFVVVSINSDKEKEKWIKSMKSDMYTSPDYVNLFTNGDGDFSPVYTHYRANVAPFLLIIDKRGKVFTRILDNTSKEIIDNINQALRAN